MDSVFNPKRAIERREQEAGEREAARKTMGAAMTQSEFSAARKMTDAEKLAQQKRLAEMLKSRK